MRAARVKLDPNQVSAMRPPTPAGGPDKPALWSGGMQVMPGALQRRSRLQRQQEVSDSCSLQRDAPERGSLTPAMRKKYLKDLLLSNASHSGFSTVLSSHNPGASLCEPDVNWALYPMEHAWMLSAVEGSYDTILEFVSEDPQLITRKDFISGYSVLHWLAKRGQDEILLKLLRYAQDAGIPVNVDVRGSGGLTPLHVASMHGRYMVIKLLVGAFGANVDAMDYSGRRAWQYLREGAPPEMKELLGAWDDEHSGGCGGAQAQAQAPAPHNANKNCNNSTAAEERGAADEVDARIHTVDGFDRTKRAGSWRFRSLRKLLPSFSFLGNKT